MAKGAEKVGGGRAAGGSWGKQARADVGVIGSVCEIVGVSTNEVWVNVKEVHIFFD
ncbi:hypothetical protein [Corynebacterium tapiri]|uniref:hypothetical protein n=1 Tax=Corynebacterium tapiri TaxID=1448266 RepID=UPI0015D57859|nr:hypothetical protein [Corynebacterium tapiri]